MARGTATVVYRQEKGQPWLGIPGVASEGDSAEEMFKAAHLDGWNVEKFPLYPSARTDSQDFEVVRTNPLDGRLDRLAIAKDRYQVYQNEQVLDFVMNTAFGDLTPVAMGSLGNGRRIFLSFEVGDKIVIKNTDDEVQCFLHTMTSHDGSWAFGTYSGNMRFRCQNMLTSIRSHAASSYKIRHTSTMEERIVVARAALGLSIKQNDLFVEDMNMLASQEVTNKKFWEIVEDLYPKPEKDVRGAVAKHDYKMSTLGALWNGPTVANLDNSGYKAYNVLNEHLRWYSTVRSGDVEGALVRASGFDEVANKTDVGLYRAVLKAL